MNRTIILIKISDEGGKETTIIVRGERNNHIFIDKNNQISLHHNKYQNKKPVYIFKNRRALSVDCGLSLQ